MADLAERLEAVVQLMVDEPEEVEVDQVRATRSEVVLEVAAADGDIGKIIGRHGRTVRALRNLLEIRGEKEERRYELEVVDD